MISVATSEDVRGIISRRKAREVAWRTGGGAAPLSRCYRHEFCGAAPPGGMRPFAELTAALKRIDPTFEIVYDKWTAPGGPDTALPAFHLYRLDRRGVTPSMDQMVFEVSIQHDLRDFDINTVWPHGKPCSPGSWLIPCVLKSYTGPLDGEYNAIRARLLREAAERERQEYAAVLRATRDAEHAIVDEIAPYLDSSVSPMGRNKTIALSGNGLAGRKRATPVCTASINGIKGTA